VLEVVHPFEGERERESIGNVRSFVYRKDVGLSSLVGLLQGMSEMEAGDLMRVRRTRINNPAVDHGFAFGFEMDRQGSG
jgi:hypothetical protein